MNGRNPKNGALVQMMFLFNLVIFSGFFLAKGHLPRCRSKSKKFSKMLKPPQGFPKCSAMCFGAFFFVFRVSFWVRANARREQVEMLEGFKVDLKGPSLPPLEDWAFSGRELTGVL